MKKSIYIILGLLSYLTISAFSQDSYRINSHRSTITVEGTSSLHDWEMKAEKMNATMKVVKASQGISDIIEVNFSLNSKDIRSDNSIMNNKTHDALKADKFHHIKFDLQSVSGLKFTSGNISGLALGELFIAGKSKRVEVPFKGKVNGDETLVITGAEKIRMSDFDINPPTAMLGTLKTGNEVNVKFELEFIK